MITLDFETKEIQGNAIVSPPKPVGVSIKMNGHPSTYYAWDHPAENNTTFSDVAMKLRLIWQGKENLLFHNAPFDLSVIRDHFGLPFPHWKRIYDTQYSIFLTEPYASSLSLKPSAERILGLPPDEQSELRAWILAHIPEARNKPSEWGAHISKAPGDLVGRYACGDTDRTYGIHERLWPRLEEMEMVAAYHREQQLMPILVESSKRGIRLNIDRLGKDYRAACSVLKKADRWIWRKFGFEFDIDSDDALADALERTGYVTEFILTPTGRRSTARKNLIKVIGDKELLVKLAYRGSLATLVRTFMGPWLQHGEADGRLHTEWNQVRSDKGDRSTRGTKTGRISSMQPNFCNVPNEQPWLPDKWPPLPEMREYLLPENGHVWLKRDFDAQEMRIAAHYEEGTLYEAFNNDPGTDPHNFVKGIIFGNTGLELERKLVKITGFQILYGGGANAVAQQLGVSRPEGQDLIGNYFGALPGLQSLSNDTRSRGRRGGFIRTWGGRVYYTEPGRLKDGRFVDFSYKLLNYLIQGSAADQTKQAIIDWHQNKESWDVFLAQVYDEINVSAPNNAAVWPESMKRLKEIMDAPRFDVPFRSSGFVGENWQHLREYD